MNSRVLQTTRIIYALILREMATKYGRSPGGYLWAIMEPLAGIALLSTAFGIMFRAPSLGTNFPLFYASGYLPYLMYMNVSQHVQGSLHFSWPLLKYPKITFMDALIARFLLNFLTNFLTAFIIFAGIFVLFNTRSILQVEYVLLAMVIAAILGFSVGTMNCFLGTKYPVWGRMVQIINRPLFVLSAIFYTFEVLPTAYQNILWYNPIIHVVGIARRGFYATYEADYVSYSYLYGLSAICLTIGLLGLSKSYRAILHS